MHCAWREALGMWFPRKPGIPGGGGAAVVRYGPPLRSWARHRREVRCIDGCAWVTVDGDLADNILYAGQTVVVAARRLACVTGMDYCIVEISRVD